MKSTYLALLLLSLISLGCDAQKPSAPANQTASEYESPNLPVEAAPASDQPAGAIEQTSSGDVALAIMDWKGIQALLASKHGKVVVMDCWSTFCEPCMKEFPGLVNLHKQYADDLACISLSFDYEGGKDETPEEHEADVLGFLKSQGAAFDNVIASVPSEELYKLLEFESAAVPAIFVYDREGKLVRQFGGPEAKYQDVEKLVAELIER